MGTDVLADDAYLFGKLLSTGSDPAPLHKEETFFSLSIAQVHQLPNAVINFETSFVNLVKRAKKESTGGKKTQNMFFC